MNTQKKLIWIIGLGIFLLCLSGCASKSLTSEELQQSLPIEITTDLINQTAVNSEIHDFEITERQTNRFTGSDLVNCTVICSNDYYRYTKYVTLEYIYTDGQWIVDNWFFNDETKVTVIIEPPLSENEIASQLPSEIFTVYIDEEPITLTMTDFKVERRKTTLENKVDTSYCIISMQNEYYSYTKYVELNYSYYDGKGGWYLDDWSYYEDTEYQLLSFPYNESVLMYYTLERCNINLLETITYTEDLSNNSIQGVFLATGQAPYTTVTTKYTTSLTFNGSGWDFSLIDTSVDVQWDIIGEYYVTRDSSDTIVYLSITDFDPVAETVGGECYCYRESSMTFSSAEEYYFFTDLPVEYSYYSGLQITLTNDSDRSVYIYFTADSASLSLAGPVFGGWDSEIYR